MLADGTIPPPTPDDIGHEPTWEGYLDHVVRRDFRALKRVLRARTASCVVVIDDVIANPASIYDEQTYHHERDQAEAEFSGRISHPRHDQDAAEGELARLAVGCLPQR